MTLLRRKLELSEIVVELAGIAAVCELRQTCSLAKRDVGLV